MGLDADRHAGPLGERDGCLEHPRRGRSWRWRSHSSSLRLPPKTRTSGHSQSLASSRKRLSSAPGSSPVSRIELSTAMMGRPTAATVCLTVARALAGIDGSISSPSMSRSSMPW